MQKADSNGEGALGERALMDCPEKPIEKEGEEPVHE